ncbi:MAG TPA: cupin domain-containing protein [Clostridiaceae bacterium]|jgi:mannose-6-phosphate isomerase-like protein (cupin superfamily)|nr:cupin domain-containing protein [Clostridiaceae bacterium]
MKCVVNVNNKQPDEDPRSLRARVINRDKQVLRDTYFLIDEDNSPTKRLKMGYTTIYPTGSTTGHTHADMEEVYFVISGEGEMVVGEDRFEIRTGDALYVPPNEFHTTYQKGNLPLVVLWVTGKID